MSTPITHYLRDSQTHSIVLRGTPDGKIRAAAFDGLREVALAILETDTAALAIVSDELENRRTPTVPVNPIPEGPATTKRGVSHV